MGCEHEMDAVRALQTGKWTADLRQHVADCQDCSQALQLAEALRAAARQADEFCQPPDPHWIFERSRRRSREIAMRRMTRLLTAVRIVAACYVVGAIGWLLRGFAALQYREVAASLPGASSRLALIGAMVAAIFVLGGLWPILRKHADRTSGR
jgi:hypothetical protein